MQLEAEWILTAIGEIRDGSKRHFGIWMRVKVSDKGENR